MSGLSLFLYAWKNVSRQPMRSGLLVGITVLLSVFALSTASLFSGKNKQIEKAIIETHQGEWQILNRHFFEEENALHVSLFDENLKQALAHTPYSPELVLNTTLLDPESPSAVTLLGIEEELHEKIFPLSIVTSDSTGDVLIGQALAGKLNLKPGDTILVAFLDKKSALQHEGLRVKGIYHQFGPAFEEKHIFIRKAQLANLLQVDPAGYNRIIVRGERPRTSDPQDVVKSWKDLNPELLTLMRFHEGITLFMMIFMLVMTFVSLITPLNVLWDERLSELNMLMTLGTHRNTMYMIALFESLILFLVSLFLSFGLFWIFFHWASQEGIDFSHFGESAVSRGGVQLSNIIFPQIGIRELLLIALFNLLVFTVGNLRCSRSRLEALYQ